MEDFLPCWGIFIITGFVQIKYEQDEFIFSHLRTFYAVFISSILQCCGYYALLTQSIIIAEAQYLSETKHAWVGSRVIFMDFLLLIGLNTSTITMSFVKRKEHLKLLNRLNRFRTKTLRHHLPLVSMLLALVATCPPVTTYNFIITFPDVPIDLGMYVFTLYAISVQYFVGHLYEFLILMKIKSIFEDLSMHGVHEEHKIRQFLNDHAELSSLLEKSERIFHLNKLICIPTCKILLSIFFFYHMDKKESIITTTMWDSIASVIFITCFAWGAVWNEVNLA